MTEVKYRKMVIFALTVILFGLGSGVFGKEGGDKAPDFTLFDLKGKNVQLSDYLGKVVILDFWATWCPPCRVEIPHFVDLQKKYGDKGLQIIGISLDRGGTEVIVPFAQKYRINYPILIGNHQVVKSYGPITGIPTTFIIDTSGSIYKKYVGYREKRVFEEDIKKLIERD